MPASGGNVTIRKSAGPQSEAGIDLSVIYTPHPGQMLCHASPAKAKVLEIGRRWGKSRFALFELLRTYQEALDIPVPPSVVPPFHAWIVAPAFPQSRQVWNELLSFVPPQLVTNVYQDGLYIHLRGSKDRPWGLVEIKSAHDPNALQTAGLDFLWVTEAQDVTDAAFEKVLPTTRSAGRLGRAVYEGIPSIHSDHWFWRMCVLAEEGADGYFYHHATSFENPFLTEKDRADIESDQQILRHAAWQRMYLAERSESAGYFQNIDACTYGDLLKEPLPGVRYVAGLDLGRKHDPTVLQVFDAARRRLVFHRAWDAGQDWPVQREAVAHLAKEVWRVERLVVDATGMGGDMFCQELMAMGLPVEEFIFTAQSRSNLLDGLAIALERNTVSFPPIPAFLRQLRVFQTRKLPSGAMRHDVPDGEHDDEVFAAALGLTACDAPVDVSQETRRGYNGRYLPTQAEAEQGGVIHHEWPRLRRLARIEAMEERARLTGVE